jgi:hypothetical protein
VAGKGVDESGMIEVADGDLKVLRCYFRCGDEALNVMAPCSVLGCWQGDEEVAGVNVPPQDGFAFGGGGLGNELREGEEVLPVGLFLLMNWSSKEVDHKW